MDPYDPPETLVDTNEFRNLLVFLLLMAGESVGEIMTQARHRKSAWYPPRQPKEQKR